MSLAWLASVAVALVMLRDVFLRTLAVAAILTAITYLVLPTGASAIAQTSQLFAVNLRYVVPALALGLVLLPIGVQATATTLSGAVIPAALLIAVAAQFEPNVWPTQTARHIAFLGVTLAILGLAVALLERDIHMRLNRVWQLGAVTALIVALVAGGVVVQRHYVRLRYRNGDIGSPGLGAIYAWAQTINHARIALYGTVEQYPLYGAAAENRVTYLGQRTANGGYRPIPSCPIWQRAVNTGHYQYLVLTPAPTAQIPVSWSTRDPGLEPVLHPGQDEWVFQISSTSPGVNCP